MVQKYAIKEIFMLPESTPKRYFYQRIEINENLGYIRDGELPFMKNSDFNLMENPVTEIANDENKNNR